MHNRSKLLSKSSELLLEGDLKRSSRACFDRITPDLEGIIATMILILALC